LKYNKIMINTFDYKNANGYNVIQVWAKQTLQIRDQGRLDSKIDLLERTETNLLPKLLHTTTKRTKHILHLVINGEVAIRPMLCRGTIDFKNEFTFLFGATEKDRKLVPRDAPERADDNREDLILHPRHRCKHERFKKNLEGSVSR